MGHQVATDSLCEVVGLIAQHRSRFCRFLRSLLSYHDDVDDLLHDVRLQASEFEIGTKGELTNSLPEDTPRKDSEQHYAL
ncbi:hypothetical protein [Aporhodopirellula aestuarii]|uniref:Uncharacterized protein n=1 Tax=Aporhodopirellula aestuarii TaxID=2950107 RepID=A0ABT0TX61_9BACT|nr:hypothetical protein [Aporhodopirellula aestuarii]MCM2369170.1 hypothetical protein [Aporhodopirellula aestuarii]